MSDEDHGKELGMKFLNMLIRLPHTNAETH